MPIVLTRRRYREELLKLIVKLIFNKEKFVLNWLQSLI